MKLLPITVLALLLSALPSLARLGETKGQCARRYGAPIKTLPTHVLVYRHAGLTIFVTYWKEKAAKIVILKTHDQSGQPITQAELDTILSSNSGGSQWNKSPDSKPDYIIWTRADQKAIARHKPGEKAIVIHDSDYAHHLEQEQEQEQKQKDREQDTHKASGS